MKRIVCFAASLMMVVCGMAQISFNSKGHICGTNGESANEETKFTLTGYAQGGYYQNYVDGNSTESNFNIARFIVMGDYKVNDKVNAYGMFDFKSGTLHELWFNYAPSSAFKVKVGQFKTPFSIENPISPTVLELISPTSLVAGYFIGGKDAKMMPGSVGRDLGVMVYGDILKEGKLTYNLAVMNGAGRNNADKNSRKDYVGTLAFSPFGKTLTVSGSVLKGMGYLDPLSADARALPGIHGDGCFRRDRYAVGFMMKTQPIELRSEYMRGRDGRMHSEGMYATALIHNKVVQPLDFILSYDYLDKRIDRQRRYTVGLQYWFANRCRFQLNYEHLNTDIRPKTEGLYAQIQVAF